MDDNLDDKKGPALGEPAPFFETSVGESKISLNDFRKKWVILFTHPDDLLPVFKTRTINYILCKRETKVIALGDGGTTGIDTGRNLLKKYILKHNLTVIDDSDGKIAASYGLDPAGPAEDEKGVFVIDPKGILRIKLSFHLSAERNFYEILKLIDALQKADGHRTKQPDTRPWRRRLGIIIRPRTATGQA